jgi:hypothetical protein
MHTCHQMTNGPVPEPPLPLRPRIVWTVPVALEGGIVLMCFFRARMSQDMLPCCDYLPSPVAWWKSNGQNGRMVRDREQLVLFGLRSIHISPLPL